MEKVCEECKYEEDQEGAIVNLSLILSAVRGHSKCTRSLLDEGTDVNHVVTQNDIRYEYRFIDRQRARRKRTNVDPRFFVGSRALFEAAYRGNNECLQLLLIAGADVNATTQNGTTALMGAATSHDLACVKLLLKAGAHVNLLDNSGHKALDHYINEGCQTFQISHVLMGAGETMEGKDLMLTLGRSLKHSCRKFIRKYLNDKDLPVNLFVKIPKLGLPRLLASYLLYNCSLND